MSSQVDVAIGAGASLVGVAIGSVATYFGQVRHWKRTSRYDRYRTFRGSCDVAFSCLQDVRHALKHELAVNDAWQPANEALLNVLRLFGEMEAGSTEKTKASAEALRDYLSGLRSELFELDHSGRKPEKDRDTYDGEFQQRRDALTRIAETELRLGRRRRATSA